MFLAFMLFITHLIACIWVLVAKVDEDQNWILKYTGKKLADGELTNFKVYLMAFYFAATTVTTVGYGDITASNELEQFFATVMLFIGVIVYAYSAGSLSSVITNFDFQQEGKKRKIETLNFIQKQYNLPQSLHRDLQWNIDFEYSSTVEGLGTFMQSLPLHLKELLATEVHRELF